MDGFEIAKILVMLLGGLAFFLYGMNLMTSGLERMAGGKLESILKRASSNKVKGMALGCGVTAVIQSSSATTVMLVGLVGSGIMTLPQTIGMLMGSNIGTTITPWITGLSSLNNNDSLDFLNLLKPSFFTPIIALIGIILIMFFANKNRKNRDIGTICLGFAVLMQGMELMSDSVSFLSEKDAMGQLVYGEAFFKAIEIFEIDYIGIWLALIVGMLFTAVIQSSSAATGVLQVLVAATTIIGVNGEIIDGMAYRMVIPLILGINIGTCITAVVSSLGANSDAKRVAVTHLIIKIIAAMLCMIPFAIMCAIGFDYLESIPNVWGIATFHTLFNVVSTFILLPFTNIIMKFSYVLVKDKKEEKKKVAYLDPILIQQSPSVAISECSNLTVEMCKIVKDTVLLSLDTLTKYNEKDSETIINNEDIVDKYEDKLGTYLVKISTRSISDADSKTVSKLLHSIDDFERLGDHAINILEVSKELNDKSIIFSEEASAEIAVITEALTEILQMTCNAFINNNIEMAMEVEPLEQVIDGLAAKVKTNHISRLRNGVCTMELGFILSDLLNNYKRISDHCSNIAVTIIETNRSSYETHQYLNMVKSGQNGRFVQSFDKYGKKFSIEEKTDSNQIQIGINEK